MSLKNARPEDSMVNNNESVMGKTAFDIYSVCFGIVNVFEII